ncbi:hypothetical protein HELRODRAFT_89932 [Helobdella robusta]|uniref:Mesoderm development candidate 2 n=1 Tax=Helobdella robusta TaxID=6412 RepID=T1G7J2_HELRO|nr:hypothetical protein HELRODRAFT_89932 [Helobdella robusta]ESN92088.1 hypothetical protein HELRODRAFT_89932 [Helobdella robusta]
MTASNQTRLHVFSVTLLSYLMTLTCLMIFLDAETSAKFKIKKKSILDYDDADVERLFEQWEENDEPLEPDELPEWKQPSPQIDLSKFQDGDVEEMLKMSKKKKTLMMFASVSGNPNKKETESISQLWQMSLFNANIEVQTYVVSENRVLLTLKDGSLAWDVKDFLIQQDRCDFVTIEGKEYFAKDRTHRVQTS